MDRLNVLLVDDEPEVCNLLRLKLAKESPEFSIRTANSAAECLEHVKRDSVDCILSDYQMPGMNGMELLDAIKEQGLDIPFIFVTGQGSEEMAREAFKNGAHDYFTKDLTGFAFTSRMANSIRQSVIRRKWTADIIRKTAEGVPFGSGRRFFDSLTRFIATSLQVDIAFIGILSEDGCQSIETVSVCARGQIAQNFSYGLANTPCETVVDNRPCIYPKNVQKLFPEDEMLEQMGLESYGGAPLYDSSGKPIGIMVIVHSEPLANEDLVRTLLFILADRASAELEKMISERRRAGHDGLKASMDAVAQPMVIIKPGHRIAMMNRAALNELCGDIEGGVAEGTKCHKLLHGLDEPCKSSDGARCPVDEVFSSGGNVTVIHTHTLPDGRKAEAEVIVSPMYAENGEVHAVVGVFNPSL